MKKDNGNNINVKIARLEEKLMASEKALQIANDSMQTRLNTMNEFREQLKDQAARFITREELTLMLDKVEVDLKILRQAKAVLEGKASQWSTNIAMLLAVGGLVLGIIRLLK